MVLKFFLKELDERIQVGKTALFAGRRVLYRRQPCKPTIYLYLPQPQQIRDIAFFGI